MRVCLISREYPPETGWGGIGTFTHHLAHGLTGLGHDVHVVSLSTSPEHPTLVETPGQPTVHRVAADNLAVKLGFVNFCLPVTRPMLEETAGLWTKFLELHRAHPFDVLECPEHFAEGLLPALVGVVPLVIRLHTPHSKLVKEKFHNFDETFDHRVLTALERVAMLSANVLISPSQDLANYVATDLNLPLDRINIVRNPVDIHKFTPDGPRAAMNNRAVNILFVGRLEQRKGVHHLIEAVPQVLQLCEGKSVHFTLIGKDTPTAAGHGSVLEELQAKLRATNCEQQATFTSQIPLTQMAEYYRAVDICVLPSLYDNAPMTVIEAMSCGKPVVGTSAGGTKEYVGHEKCGLIVPPADSLALAQALSTLILDDKKRASMGAAARINAVENFSVQHMSEQTVNMYESAIQLYRNRHAALYPGQPERLTEDLHSLIDSLERRLYEMTYSNSWRFRINHWRKRAKEQPGGFITRALKKPFSKI
ncbi:MAG: glycosyltransferase family 4 protein [Candidatus Obscuribacterales bacterium]|nr:glycosyltransferase family 4 protein [Candidatus Obscuribacterales bacterium]